MCGFFYRFFFFFFFFFSMLSRDNTKNYPNLMRPLKTLLFLSGSLYSHVSTKTIIRDREGGGAGKNLSSSLMGRFKNSLFHLNNQYRFFTLRYLK